MYRDIVGANIRKYRVENNWTQEKLGELLSVTHQVISKWENGIAAPELGVLCTMAKMFDVSLDTLCGLQENDMSIMEKAKDISTCDATASYENLLERLEQLKNLLALYPTNEDLLMHILQFARFAHDHCDTDTHIDQINDEIEMLAQRILDFSINDAYRSVANYNMALCYLERVNRVRANEEDKQCAQKANEYAQKVLYKDMDMVIFESFGTVTTEDELAACETTLMNAYTVLQRSARNLCNRYQYVEGADAKMAAIEAFAEQTEDAFEQLEKVLA